MKYYYINVEICEGYPCYDFVIKARTIESATSKAHKIVKQDYPEDYTHAKSGIYVKEVTAESLLKEMTVN